MMKDFSWLEFYGCLFFEKVSIFFDLVQPKVSIFFEKDSQLLAWSACAQCS